MKAMSSITREIVNLTHANVETIRKYLLRGRRTVAEVVQLRQHLAGQMKRSDRKILFALTRHLYDDEVASYLLGEVIGHMQRLEKALDRAVSIKVAALDYFETVEEISDQLELIHEDQIRQLVHVAIFDELTGALTREFFDYRLTEEIERSHRYGTPLSLLMIDIDHFKRYNDTYGHPAGDEVLRLIGRVIDQSKRETDLFYRYGGEEFALLLPETDRADGAQVAGRILAAVPEASEAAGSIEERVTVSIGLAQLVAGQDGEALLREADTRLYRAKRSGRNRIVDEKEGNSDGQGG